MDEEYKKLYDISYFKALSKTNDAITAEEIASQVIYLYFLNKESIRDEHKIKWIFKTTGNYISKHFDKIKKEQNFKKKINNKLNKQQSENEKINLIYKSYLKSLKKLNENEKEILEAYLQNNLNSQKTAFILNMKHSTFRKTIYRIKKKIQAYGYRDLGYVATKAIVTPNLNRKILRFLEKFKIALNNNELVLLKPYFEKSIFFDFKNFVPIQNIKDYDITLCDDIYRLNVVFKDINNTIKSFSIQFKIDKNNSLKIVSKPKLEKNITVVPLESNSGMLLKKLINKANRAKDGTLQIPKELIEKIIKEYKEKKE